MRVTLIEKPTDLVRVTSDILENLISKMGVSALVSLKNAEREDVGGPVFDIDGDDSGLLIGRQGETLRAIQFLVSFIAGRKLGERANVLVDVAGYQERRRQALTNLAQRVAQRVVATGRPITLEPMPPNERRIIHLALADSPSVATVSTGDGDARQVVVQLEGEPTEDEEDSNSKPV